MKILPSLETYRSLGVEASVLGLLSLSDMCMWRMHHGLRGPNPPAPDKERAPFAIEDDHLIRTTIFDTRHALTDLVIDVLQASDTFVAQRQQQLCALQDDLAMNREQLRIACLQAMQQGMIPNRRLPDALALTNSESSEVPGELNAPSP